MTRRRVAAMAIWALVVAVWVLLFYGGHVAGCLGPLGVTPEQCRAILGLPPETAWDRFSNGMGLPVAVILGGWVAIALIGRRLRHRAPVPDKRQPPAP